MACLLFNQLQQRTKYSVLERWVYQNGNENSICITVIVIKKHIHCNLYNHYSQRTGIIIIKKLWVDFFEYFSVFEWRKPAVSVF